MGLMEFKERRVFNEKPDSDELKKRGRA